MTSQHDILEILTVLAYKWQKNQKFRFKDFYKNGNNFSSEWPRNLKFWRSHGEL